MAAEGADSGTHHGIEGGEEAPDDGLDHRPHDILAAAAAANLDLIEEPFPDVHGAGLGQEVRPHDGGSYCEVASYGREGCQGCDQGRDMQAVTRDGGR